MRAVTYVRVSTDAQERDGTSLESQQRACTEHAHAGGWLVTEEIRDTASGYTLERPGIERLRQLLRHGAVDVVVAYAVDRLSRNQNHIGVLFDEVERAGARLEFVTEKFEDTAVGRFILTARAFIAEVEREKIAERTMRGKAERARSGKLPQATGKGIYGYRYNRETGRREIDAFQAAVVERIFGRFAETRSFSAVARELNDADIPAFEGGRWYPITIRRVLTNETYTGRTVYRRTKRVAARNPTAARRRSRVMVRPEEEWIEVDGVTPSIIDQSLWQRVQAIIADPERSRRQPTGRFYPLRSRVCCAVCGAAMVGQTLTVKQRPFRYYRCRHAYTTVTSYQCSSRYVRADELESAIWEEVKEALARSQIVLHEWLHQANAPVDQAQIAQLEQEVAALREREARLVRLFALGEFDEAVVREEAADLRRQRTILEERLAALRPQASFAPVDEERLERVCAAVRAWLENADEQQRVQALEAMQVTIEASKSEADLRGVLPLEPPSFISDEESCRCSSSGDEPARVGGAS